MHKLHAFGMLGVLLLSAVPVRADLIVEPTTPPQEKVLTGTLSWENVKQRDGSTVKGRLLLDEGGRQIALPVVSGSKVRGTNAGEAIDVSAFVGKRVKVTAKVIETVKRGPVTLVVSVTRIEENAAPAVGAVEGKGRQLGRSGTGKETSL